MGAEKQAESEEKAHQEELKNNPMKLLEERTEQSKNEMELMESLEELQELNKRTVKVDEDESFIQSVFGKESNSGSSVKRIADQEDYSSDEDRPMIKVPKADKATELLGNSSKACHSKSKSWEKSIGTIVTKKSNLLVKPKSSPSTSTALKLPSAETTKPNSLGLIASYSDSDEDSDE